MKLPNPRVLPVLFLSLLAAAACALGQDFGTVQLPADLADASAKILGAHNIDSLDGDPDYVTYSEGPAVDAEGNLFFTENSLKIWKVPPQGPPVVFLEPSDAANGLEFDPQGLLVACQNNKLTRFEKNGSQTVLSATGGGTTLGAVNDLSIGSSGAMFFTNYSGNTVFYRAPGGTLKATPVPNTPNGVEWVEEKGIVLVNQALTLAQGGRTVKYQMAADGSLINPVTFHTVNVPDGLTLDERGNVYVAAHGDGAVQVFDSTGNPLGKITVRNANAGALGVAGNVSNCVFGGPGSRTLYMTGNGGAYKVELKVAGRKRPGTSRIARLPLRISGLAARPRIFSVAGRDLGLRPQPIPAFPLFRSR